jgi:hypothetical protein
MLAIKLRIQEKTGMTDQAFDEVDWDGHMMAVGRSQLSQPFGTLINKYDLVKYTIDCPICRKHIEMLKGWKTLMHAYAHTVRIIPSYPCMEVILSVQSPPQDFSQHLFDIFLGVLCQDLGPCFHFPSTGCCSKFNLGFFTTGHTGSPFQHTGILRTGRS